jgi:amino acid transporter
MSDRTQSTTSQLARAMGLWDVVLLNVVAIVGLRWLLTAAQIGPESIMLWFLALAIFFIPQGLAVSELSAHYPEEGGIYAWTKRAFGPSHGFVAGWCYWVNNLIYYPSLLIFLAGNAIFIAGSQSTGLAENKIYVALFSIGVLWLAMILNMVGLRTGKWVQNTGAIGNWLPAMVLIVLGVIAGFKFGSNTEFTFTNIFPDLGTFGTISFFATMCFGFAGLELASVMGEEIEDTQRTIPRAIVISGFIITAIYILGTGAMLVVLPSSEINIISGIVESIGAVGEQLGMPWLLNAAALSITIGGIGGAGAWLAGTARIPFVVGVDNYLPKSMGRVHPEWGTPHIAILVQGILSTVFILMSVIGSTVEEAYIVLLDATLILYFIPYLYLFIGLIVLRNKREKSNEPTPGMVIPGGKIGLYLVAFFGFSATALSIILSIMPPEHVENVLLFEMKVIGGTAMFLLVGLIFFLRGRRKNQAEQRHNN